jgi:tRNA threonylcarbamoyladenosine modification (KEOPS) complex  Pcc1 subunit
MSELSEWQGVIEVSRPDAGSAERLRRALDPEAAREVPRARAHLLERSDRTVRLEIRARDTGALRAAVNTYLGWVALATRTEAAALSPSKGPTR